MPPFGKPSIDVPGGSLLYAAAGAGVWENGIGLVGRVGEDFPQEWLERLRQLGFDIRGIKFLDEPLDLRAFYAYPDLETCQVDNPVSHFARLGLPFPKLLLGYTTSAFVTDSRLTQNVFTIRPGDLPPDYFDATAVHLCPLDYLSHTLLPPALRQGHVTTITLNPSPGYMTPLFWDHIQAVIRGITAFLVTEEKLRALFQGRSDDLWEMVETIAGYGCEVVVLLRGLHGQWVYERASRTKWQVPAYSAPVQDPTGSEHAFCGGFITGYRASYNALEGTLSGNISASLASEGSGPFYALDAMPGLARYRMAALRDLVRKV